MFKTFSKKKSKYDIISMMFSYKGKCQELKMVVGSKKVEKGRWNYFLTKSPEKSKC